MDVPLNMNAVPPPRPHILTRLLRTRQDPFNRYMEDSKIRRQTQSSQPLEDQHSSRLQKYTGSVQWDVLIASPPVLGLHSRSASKISLFPASLITHSLMQKHITFSIPPAGFIPSQPTDMLRPLDKAYGHVLLSQHVHKRR